MFFLYSTIQALEELGFTYKGDILSKVHNTEEKSERHFFALYNDEKTIDFVHIHALPKDDPEAKNLILFRDKLREDPKKIEIYKTAYNQCRPYLSIKDAFKVFKFCIEKGIYKNDVYNVLTGNYTVKQLAEIAESAHHHILGEQDDWFDKISINLWRLYIF